MPLEQPLTEPRRVELLSTLRPVMLFPRDLKYIRYDGSRIMAGDAITDAVSEYAAVLRANQWTDIVHVRRRTTSGRRSTRRS